MWMFSFDADVIIPKVGKLTVFSYIFELHEPLVKFYSPKRGKLSPTIDGSL